MSSALHLLTLVSSCFLLYCEDRQEDAWPYKHGRHAGRQGGRQADRQVDRQTDKASRQTDRQTDRQVDRRGGIDSTLSPTMPLVMLPRFCGSEVRITNKPVRVCVRGRERKRQRERQRETEREIGRASCRERV